MSWNFLILVTALLAACNFPEASRSLDGTYGSLSFTGAVDRRVDGTNYVYTVRNLHLTLDPEANSNATDQISDPSLRFVATVKSPDGTPYKVTFESLIPIKAQLDGSHRTTRIRDVEFVVPRDAVDSADHAGLSVVDGRLMWPMSTELKS